MKHSHDFDFKIQFTDDGRPFLIVDNFLTNEEYETVLSELDTVIRPNLRRENTGGATDANGKSIKLTNACFIGDIYVDPRKSPTFNITHKFFTDPVFHRKLVNSHWMFEWFGQYGVEETMQFLYYDEKDTYGHHADNFNTTALLWLSKEPRGFEGGDFIIDKKHKIDFKNNRMVIFSLNMLHCVTPIKKTTELDGYGRYCVSKFMRPSL